jgi:hypothetical protein
MCLDWLLQNKGGILADATKKHKKHRGQQEGAGAVTRSTQEPELTCSCVLRLPALSHSLHSLHVEHAGNAFD